MQFPECTTPLTACPFCPNELPLQSLPVRVTILGLTYERGLQRVRVAPARCAQCHTRFVSCWETEDSPRLVCDPTHSSWFVFRMRLREESFAALHADYLRFMTAAFLHLRASFSGIALTAASMFLTGVLGANDCNRALIHGWFLHSLASSLWTEARCGMRIDVRLDKLDTTLTHFEPSLHDLLHDLASTHACARCANSVLTGDGGMKLTTAICNERTSQEKHDETLGVRVLTGCTNRPQRGSLFCKKHYLPPSATPAPEIRDHKLQHGQLQFRYVGHDDWVDVPSVPLKRLQQYDSRLLLGNRRRQQADVCGITW